MISPTFVTIDSSNTRDIDDAMSISHLDDGFVVSVAIADPSSSISIGSEADQLALDRAATVYSGERTVRPMLPKHVSADLGSLIAGKSRQAMVFTIVLDKSLDVIEFEASSQVIIVKERLSYDAIPAILQGASGELRELLTLLSRVCTMLLQRRRAKGALALYDLSQLMLSDEEGNLRQFESQAEMIGHIIVQEMMILTNTQFALYMAQKNIPAIYRNHSCRVSAPPATDLADTVDQWLKAGLAKRESVAVQIGTLVEKAVYGSLALGHYGLCVPLYLHGTSPLRRYADLVNIRQLRAHIDGHQLPYDQASLTQIADSLTTTLRERSEAKAIYHKQALAEKAKEMIESDDLTQMEDNVLSAAVKFSKDAGHLPNAVLKELIRRLDNSSIADAIVDRLALQVPRSAITPELGEAFSRWMHGSPPSVVRVLMNGLQTNVFADFVSNDLEAEGGFRNSASVICVADGIRYEGVGVGTKKRTAEQKAIVGILCNFLDLPTVFPEIEYQAIPVRAESPSNKNPKSALLELCQKKAWPTPDFQVAVSGPSNASRFVSTATIRTPGGRLYTASSPVMATKKESEAAAAAAMLEELTPVAAEGAADRISFSGVNPVGQLQEFSQKRKAVAPQYKFSQLGAAPHSFECNVTIQIASTTLSATANGASKKVAKERAASSLLEKLNSGLQP